MLPLLPETLSFSPSTPPLQPFSWLGPISLGVVPVRIHPDPLFGSVHSPPGAGPGSNCCSCHWDLLWATGTASPRSCPFPGAAHSQGLASLGIQRLSSLSSIRAALQGCPSSQVPIKLVGSWAAASPLASFSISKPAFLIFSHVCLLQELSTQLSVHTSPS